VVEGGLHWVLLAAYLDLHQPHLEGEGQKERESRGGECRVAVSNETVLVGEQEQIESGRSRVRGILMRAYVSVHQCARMYVCIRVCVCKREYLFISVCASASDYHSISISRLLSLACFYSIYQSTCGAVSLSHLESRCIQCSVLLPGSEQSGPCKRREAER
jgi:hypothetical protein